MEAQTIYGITSFIVAWGSSLDHRHQHSLWWYCRPWWFLRPSPEKNPSSSLASFVTQSQGSPKILSQVRGLNLYLLKLQAVVHYSANPTGLTMTACRPQSTLLPVTFLTSLVLFLSLARTLLPSIFPTSPSHICSFSVSGWLGLPCFILLMWPNVWKVSCYFLSNVDKLETEHSVVEFINVFDLFLLSGRNHKECTSSITVISRGPDWDLDLGFVTHTEQKELGHEKYPISLEILELSCVWSSSPNWILLQSTAVVDSDLVHFELWVACNFGNFFKNQHIQYDF